MSTDSSAPLPPASADLLDTPAAGPTAARGGAVRATGYAIGTLLALISAPLMIRHLGVEDFGRYVTVLSVVAIVAGISEAGVAVIALREYATLAGAERERVMRDLLGIRIVLTILGVLAAVGFAALAGYDDAMVVGTAVAGVGLLTYVLSAAFGLPLAAHLGRLLVESRATRSD
ncbi:MAG: oligosaccharide flippase family protein, partial [Actinobacteria bacterium]|nr:oligosaccharide flippase family protein [Actinomycetota bacterium]